MVLDRDDRKMPKDSGRDNGQTWRADGAYYKNRYTSTVDPNDLE